MEVDSFCPEFDRSRFFYDLERLPQLVLGRHNFLIKSESSLLVSNGDKPCNIPQLPTELSQCEIDTPVPTDS